MGFPSRLEQANILVNATPPTVTLSADTSAPIIKSNPYRPQTARANLIDRQLPEDAQNAKALGS